MFVIVAAHSPCFPCCSTQSLLALLQQTVLALPVAGLSQGEGQAACCRCVWGAPWPLAQEAKASARLCHAGQSQHDLWQICSPGRLTCHVAFKCKTLLFPGSGAVRSRIMLLVADPVVSGTPICYQHAQCFSRLCSFLFIMWKFFSSLQLSMCTGVP